MLARSTTSSSVWDRCRRSYSPCEARSLTADLAKVANGEAFLLQAGDCAESFDAFSADAIRDKLKVILQMAVVLMYSSGVPVVKIGRIAGQFAKPRSAGTETVNGVELPSFRGHMVNDIDFTPEARLADPERLITAYQQSAATLNLVRAFTKGGFGDLSRVHAWNQEFVASSAEGQRYEEVAAGIERALQFMSACGVDIRLDTTTAHRRCFDKPRSPHPWLRRSTHSPGFPDWRLVRLLGTHALDR